MELIIFMFFVSYVNCQFEFEFRGKPEKCHGSIEFLTRQCCIFPPFFKRDVAKLCGAKFSLMFINNSANVTGLLREVNDPCEHWTCILRKYDLLNSEDKLDEDKYFRHLDKWVGLNPEFASIMFKAKIHCKQQYRLIMPLEPCEFNNLQSCIRNFINVSCPKMIPSAECIELKLFYEECREYFIN